MAVSKEPWELHSDLTRDRLYRVAQAIYDARLGALARFKPTKGETGWSHGCVAHEWCKAALRRLEDASSFLRTESHNGRFTFHVGAVPFRFYQADPKHPRAKYSRVPSCRAVRARRHSSRYTNATGYSACSWSSTAPLSLSRSSSFNWTRKVTPTTCSPFRPNRSGRPGWNGMMTKSSWPGTISSFDDDEESKGEGVRDDEASAS